MIEYDDLYKLVKNNLSTKRFNHTLRVVERAIEYSKIYNVDENVVKLCALAHDIAKELNDVELSKYYNLLDEIEIVNASLQHAKIGSIICKEFDFSEDMINSIKYHTTGRENMSILEKIIYLADATESEREIGKNYVELVKTNIDKAMLEISSLTLKKLLDKGKVIHVNTIKCYNYYNILLGGELYQ